ncbi:MAG: thioredoxin-disulfide reductase [Candidatus Babeliales bacterium]
MPNTIHQLIIIGSGPAGLTAGIYAARANLNPLIIEGVKPGGQLMYTTAVENWPSQKTIMGPKLMMDMRAHAEHFGCQFISGDVSRVDFSQMPFTLWTNNDQMFKTQSVIIATGATPKRLGIPGEDHYWGKGVTTCAVCDGAFYKDKKVIIVGGGDTAMEDASFMTRFTNDIHIIQISDQLSASYPMQKKVLDNPIIKISYASTLSAIEGDGTKLTHATITNKKTGTSQKVAVDGIFVAIGLTPNTTIFKNQLAMNNYGYLTLNNYTSTSVNGIFAAGDVADDKYRQAITSAGTGCMAAMDAQRYLSNLLA